MERRAWAAVTVLTGAVIGLLANLFFLGRMVGISLPLFAGLVTLAVLALARPAGFRLRPRNLWPLLPLLFFATMIAVRDDPLITLLNLLAVLALGGLVLHYLPLARPLDEDALPDQTAYVLDAGFLILPHALYQAADAWGWLRERRYQRRRQVAAVARGLVFALPVLLVFGFLLGSADAVFASYVNQTLDGLVKLFGVDFSALSVTRLAFTGFMSALGTGAIGYAWARRERRLRPAGSDMAEPQTDDELSEKRKPILKLGMIEAGIVLGGVVALFGLFVLVQFAYFFGGQANITGGGFTYAEYARRGFFELVAVSVLTLGLALGLDHVTVRQEGREEALFRGLALAMTALVGVMLVSASRRMLLYEEAYGFTQLRVYTHVFMHWLAVLFGVFALALFRVHKNVFSLGALLVIIGYLATLNLLNVDAYIAERNIARYREGRDLDIAFLHILSADAVPAILPLYRSSENDPDIHSWSGQWLARQLRVLDHQRATTAATVFSRHLGRDMAWAQLDAARSVLPAFDPEQYYPARSMFESDADRLSEYLSGWEMAGTPLPGLR